MNIYIHLEIAVRELDSKLLLAVRAAERGHDVLISNLGIITKLCKKGVLMPGIYHTKDLTPCKETINRHEKFKKKGFLVTSIDEEAGLTYNDYDSFAKHRYSNESIDKVAAVFCWGSDDYLSLKKQYDKYSDRIFCTGSPRVDLWKYDFVNYWGKPEYIPKKPYILISSNFGGVNNYKRYWELIDISRNLGYFERDPILMKKSFESICKQYSLLYEFVKGIEYIAENRRDIEIIVRPHPVEDPESWKTLLKPYPNIHVIRKDQITPWVQNASAIIHNGCTTAFEASIAGIPVIAYIPFKPNFEKELANKISIPAFSPEELLKEVDKAVNENQILADSLPLQNDDIIKNKIRYQDQELASDRIIQIWEQIGKDLPEKSSNWLKIKYMLKLTSIISYSKQKIGLFFRLINHQDENYKFPPFNVDEIEIKVNRLSDTLGITTPLHVIPISDRALLITRKKW